MIDKTTNNHERKIPDRIVDSQKWNLDRRSFLRISALSGVFAHSLLLDSCFNNTDIIDPLSRKQYGILKRVQDILFPSEENEPGAIDFKADRYIVWMLNDKRIDTEENEFLINGLNWVEETAEEERGESFLKLTTEDQDALIEKIAVESWGESWLSVNLTYIFEAMISDPIYGFNDLEKGWKWLDHQVGMPRPDIETKYPEIFNTLNF